MEKRNVVEDRRTPDHERKRPDDDWDKTAADMFSDPRSKVTGDVTVTPTGVKQLVGVQYVRK